MRVILISDNHLYCRERVAFGVANPTAPPPICGLELWISVGFEYLIAFFFLVDEVVVVVGRRDGLTEQYQSHSRGANYCPALCQVTYWCTSCWTVLLCPLQGELLAIGMTYDYNL